MDEHNLLATLGRMGAGINEIMCHPGLADSATASRYPWGYHWDDETSALRSSAVRRVVEDYGIILSNFHNAWSVDQDI
jgi:predicted glycoside hydrolase/deacetylase ChbG (UPF0249 family)